MASFSHLPLLLLLLLATAALSADPRCGTGVRGGLACCARSCGTCGGSGCGTRSRRTGTQCCVKAIVKRAQLCTSRNPPCLLRPARPPSPTLRGRWVTAPVSSGALTKRHEACAVMVRGQVVLLGGRGANKPVSVYNPKTRAWSNRDGPGPGVEIHHMQCVVVGSRVYIPTSWTGGFPFERNADKFYVYDVAADRWSTRAPLPKSRRRGGAAAVLRNGVIYVVAGNRGGHGGHATSFGWMDAYSIASNSWRTNLPTMPSPRDHTGGALVKGQLCVAGGRDGGARNFFNENKAATWCYSFATRKWVKKADFPMPRAGANTGAICGGGMMIAGGEGSGDASNRVHVFDGSRWTEGPRMVMKRHGSGLAVAKCTCGQIFIPSGSGSQGGSPELLTTERFLPVGKPVNCASY